MLGAYKYKKRNNNNTTFLFLYKSPFQAVFILGREVAYENKVKKTVINLKKIIKES